MAPSKRTTGVEEQRRRVEAVEEEEWTGQDRYGVSGNGKWNGNGG